MHSPSSDPAAEALGDADRRYRAALDKAMRYLAAREHTTRELVSKLRAKGVDEASAQLVVDDLRGRGLQSDQRFVESFVRSRLGRGQGPLRIRQELRQRGVDDDLASEALDLAEGDWQQHAAEAKRRRFGADAPADRDDWNRQARFLSARGVPADLVYRVLGRND